MMTKPRRRLAAAAFRCGLLLAVPLCIVAGCGRKPPPHVILIVVDTLRADRLGAYGSQRGLTPFLDQLAHRGTVFRNAYAASSWTCPSVASLFTSRYPSQHKVIALDSRLPDSEVTLVTRRGRARFAVQVTPGIRPDTVFVPFHWDGEESANRLTNPAFDPVSRMPEFKVCAVRIETTPS